MRRIAIVLAILVLPPVSKVHVRTQGLGQNFMLVEEVRLPPDTEQAGTSTLDIDLVDVDSDGDLDIYKAQGTDSLDGRPNQLLINTGSGNFVDESAARLPPENLVLAACPPRLGAALDHHRARREVRARLAQVVRRQNRHPQPRPALLV